MLITIDGPAGSGKSSIAKKLAEQLHFDFFDTGAMYRSLTWFLLENKIDIHNKEELKKAIENFNFDIEALESTERRYIVNNKDVSSSIRSCEITQKVSEVSALAEVRKHIVSIQQKFGKSKNSVFEGRDMGTVVFPYADVKFFLTATPEIRADRRFKETIERFPDLSASCDYKKILADIIKRDETDSTRAISPLKKAKDAYVIDTSKLSLDQVTKKLIKIIKKVNKRRHIPRPLFLKMRPFYGFVVFTIWLFLKILYRFKVYGINNFIKGPAIIASNHVSFYDPPAIAAAASEEVHFLAKESLFRVPILKYLIRSLNSHPLSGGASDVASIKKITRLIGAGKKVVIFPEGERSFDGELGPIMPGVGFMVYLSKCVIIPAYIDGAYKVWKRESKWPKLFGRIKVVFGTPIYYSQFESLKKADCMKEINKELEKSILSLKKWCEDGFEGDPP